MDHACGQQTVCCANVLRALVVEVCERNMLSGHPLGACEYGVHSCILVSESAKNLVFEPPGFWSHRVKGVSSDWSDTKSSFRGRVAVSATRRPVGRIAVEAVR